jgi:quercetin dioxygenase-like cupin family protein
MRAPDTDVPGRFVMSIITGYQLLPMVGDPDDHRPNTRWATLVDPEERVDSLAVIIEELAPGDRIPLHTHPVDEVVLYRGGGAIATVGDVRRTVGQGDVVFIPAGTPHATHNVGSDSASLFAVFPSTRIGIEYLERNPAPGTEGAAAQPPTTYDLRTGEVVASD